MLHASVLALGMSDLTAVLDFTYSTSSGAEDKMTSTKVEDSGVVEPIQHFLNWSALAREGRNVDYFYFAIFGN